MVQKMGLRNNLQRWYNLGPVPINCRPRLTRFQQIQQHLMKDRRLLMLKLPQQSSKMQMLQLVKTITKTKKQMSRSILLMMKNRTNFLMMLRLQRRRTQAVCSLVRVRFQTLTSEILSMISHKKRQSSSICKHLMWLKTKSKELRDSIRAPVQIWT